MIVCSVVLTCGSVILELLNKLNQVLIIPSQDVIHLFILRRSAQDKERHQEEGIVLDTLTGMVES